MATTTTYTYPVSLKKDGETILVSFPDFPEAHTFGESRDEALGRAIDALATVIDAYIADRKDIPAPSTVRGLTVTLPALMASKVALYEGTRNAKVGKAELARRLHWHLPQVDRLLDVHHGSHLDHLEAAFGAIGKRLTVCVVDSGPFVGAVRTRPARRLRRAASARRHTQ